METVAVLCQDPRFRPDNSSSYQVVGCRSPDCVIEMCDAESRQSGGTRRGVAFRDVVIESFQICWVDC